jgi:hypothetical protein
VKGSDLVYHEIASNNILLGSSIFLTLGLPQSWDISMGAGRPEITASHEHNGRRWVATGDAWYILHDPGRRWAMEVRLTAKLPRRSGAEAIPQEITIAGHPARVTWARRQRGLIKRWTVTYVTVEFHCPHTDRQLRLEFSGRVPDEAFVEIIEAAKFIRCH